MHPVQIGYLQAVLLGLLQGITEFLPVSSTAHMAIAPQLLFHMEDPGATFSAIVQLGPIIAIIAYFRHDLAQYWHGILRTGNPLRVPPEDIEARLGWFTLLGTLPLMVFGVLLEKKIDTVFRDLNVIAFSLIALALVLWVAERIAPHTQQLERLTLRQSQVIGWAQVLALVPGTSRSGVTITAALFQGLDRESAARFSFLLSIPAITAAGLYKLAKVAHATRLDAQLGPYLVGTLVAGLCAYVIVRWFMGYMKEHSTGIFIVYRIGLGLLLLYLLHSGIVQEPSEQEAARPAATPTRLVDKVTPALVR